MDVIAIWGKQVPYTELINLDAYEGIDVPDIVEDISHELTIAFDEETQMYSIGLEPTEMEDEETLAEFKERIANTFCEVGIDTEAQEIGFVIGTIEQ
jgi:hypothetical protein